MKSFFFSVPSALFQEDWITRRVFRTLSRHSFLVSNQGRSCMEPSGLAWSKSGLAWNYFWLLSCGNWDCLSRRILHHGRWKSAVFISRKIHGYSSVLLSTYLWSWCLIWLPWCRQTLSSPLVIYFAWNWSCLPPHDNSSMHKPFCPFSLRPVFLWTLILPGSPMY